MSFSFSLSLSLCLSESVSSAVVLNAISLVCIVNGYCMSVCTGGLFLTKCPVQRVLWSCSLKR